MAEEGGGKQLLYCYDYFVAMSHNQGSDVKEEKEKQLGISRMKETVTPQTPDSLVPFCETW